MPSQSDNNDVLDLIQRYSGTWTALERFDKNEFPSDGTISEIQLSAKELVEDLKKLKKELISRGEATDLFGQEKRSGSLEGIFGNVFQTIFGEDAYPSLEEKAAHLIYFVVKNHPFNDGNKRSGALTFIWFLNKAGISFRKQITSQTLTILTLLIAQSNPADKEKMIGIIMLLLN